MKQNNQNTHNSKYTKKESILVISDSESDSDTSFLSEVLKDFGYQVYSSTNINNISKLFDSILTPDIILLDFNDSGLRAIDTCKKIKLNQKSKQIPVIFISSRLHSHSMEEAFVAGGFDYITKPFHLGELTSRVKNAITVHKQQKQSEDRLHSLLLLHGKRTAKEKDLLDYALEEAVRLTYSKCGYLHFVDDDKNSISLNSWSKETLKLCDAEKTPHYPLSNAGIWADCVRERKPVIHNDYSNYPRKKGYPKGHFPVLRHMSVPIFDDNKIVAVIGVGNKEEPYNEGDQRQLTLFFSSTWDIIKQKRSEEENKKIHFQLQQAQKMEAIGTLAGGIAHDFNNILSSIIGFTQLAMTDVEKGTDIEDDLQEVYKAANRATDLVKQILTISRHDETKTWPIQVTPLIREALKMLRSTIPTSIKFRENISNERMVVEANPTQLHQVVVNLVTNAKQAMTDGSGVLEICVDSLNFESNDTKNAYLELLPGRYARITVGDTGIGILDKDIKKIFDPYFTTKEKGEGTGLGLSVVHSIVKSQGGHITVYSEPGKGTTFHVYLPLLKKDSDDLPQLTDEPLPTGTEHVLLIDDEPQIIKFQQKILENLGYRVTTRTNSIKALEIFHAFPDRFDLIITDMTMPDMTGDKVAQEIKLIRPDMRVILCTGFSEKVSGQENDLNIDKFLMKPVDRAKLANVIRNVLDAGRSSD